MSGQIEAAMPAMREWWAAFHAADGGNLHAARRYVRELSDETVEIRVDRTYPGGVDQFIRDQEAKRG